MAHAAQWRHLGSSDHIRSERTSICRSWCRWPYRPNYVLREAHQFRYSARNRLDLGIRASGINPFATAEHILFSQTQGSEKADEARVGSQTIERGVNIDRSDDRKPIVSSLFKPRHGLFFVAETGVHECHAPRTRRRRSLFQLLEDPASFLGKFTYD